MNDPDNWIDNEPDETDTERDPAWKKNLLGAPPTQALGEVPIVRYVQIRMTPEVANLMSRVARTYGLTREAWMRKALAEALAPEVPGITPDDLLVRMPKRHGAHGQYARPETTRKPRP